MKKKKALVTGGAGFIGSHLCDRLFEEDFDVYVVDDLSKVDVQTLGKVVRNHPIFRPKGTNVNFVQVLGKQKISIRTYERGVEGETLACGTGVVASAILASCRKEVEPPVQVETRGGEILQVFFQPGSEDFAEVYLEGLTKTTFEGTIIEL